MALIGLKQLDPILTGSLQVSGSAGVTGSIEVSGNITGSSTSTGSFGYMNVSGDTVIGGNLTLGDADTDSVSFGGEISSSLIPDADITYDVGSSSKRWRYGHIQQISVTHITASGNISSSGTVTLPTTLRFEGGSGGVRYS
jgi:hypothetical protein